MNGKMIDLVIQEPCRSCQGLWLKVEQPAYVIDCDGRMKNKPAEVRCIHEKMCSKLNAPKNDEEQLAEKIREYLDTHPDKDISVQLHCEGGDWKHEVRIEKRKYAKF